MIYSHTHGDHWGGVRGLLDEADVRSGKVPVIAPIDFMEFTVSENVYAGNAMNRRLSKEVPNSIGFSKRRGAFRNGSLQKQKSA